MKSKKIISISVIAVIIFGLIIGVVYFNTHYAIIDRKIYKNDIIKISPDLRYTNIKEINKCTEIETMYLSHASKNSIAKFINFHNLNELLIMRSDISSSDSEKISMFGSLKDLTIANDTTVDFKGFNNDTVSSIVLFKSEIKNFKALSECSSLKKIVIYYSTVSDNCIDNNYVMKDSSVFASFDYVEKLSISVDKIEDISGIIEMDSLKEITLYEESIREDDKKLLEDKGISVIFRDEN